MPAFPGVGWSEAEEPIVALQPGLEEEGEEEQPYGGGDSEEAPRMAAAEEDAVKVRRAGAGQRFGSAAAIFSRIAARGRISGAASAPPTRESGSARGAAAPSATHDA